MTTENEVRAAVGLPPRPVSWLKRFGITALAVLVVWSYYGLEFKWSRLLEAPVDVWRLLRAMVTDIAPAETGEAVGQMIESITMAWMGTLIATVFAIPLAFVAAENLVGKPIAIAFRQVLNVLRAVPEIILALAFIPAFGLTPLAGVAAIGVGSIGSLGKLFYEIIEGVQRGPIEGADAVGANSLERLRWGVVPQVAPELASLVLYRFEVNIRASAVLGLLGAGGIGEMVATSFQFNQYGTAAIGLIVMIVGTIMVDLVSGWVRRRIIAGPGVELSPSDDVDPEKKAQAMVDSIIP